MVKKVSAKRLSEELGVSVRSIERYWKRGCPWGPVDAVKRWRAQNIKSEVIVPSGLREAQARADIARTLETAKNQRIKNDNLEDSLVDRARIRGDARQALQLMTQRLRKLVTECGDAVPAELCSAVYSIIGAATDVAIKEFSDADILK